VLIGQLKVSTQIPTTMANAMACQSQELAPVGCEAPSIGLLLIKGQVDQLTKSFKVAGGSHDMFRLFEEQLPIIHKCQGTTWHFGYVHPPMQKAVQQNHGNNRETITLRKACAAVHRWREVLAHIKVSSQLAKHPYPPCQKPQGKVHHHGKFKDHWATKTIESLLNVTYHARNLEATVMCLFNGKQDIGPNQPRMTGQSRSKQASW
jgi:hypothetical protein